MLIESFLDYLQYERNYSEKTVLAYGEDIKQLQEFAQEEYGKFNPLEVEAELIREWIVSLMDKGYTLYPSMKQSIHESVPPRLLTD